MTLFLGAKSHFKTGIPIVSEIQQKYFGKRKGYISFLTSFVPSPIGKYIQTYNKNYIIQHSKYFHNLDFAAWYWRLSISDFIHGGQGGQDY